MAKTSDRRYKKAVQPASKRSQVKKRTMLEILFVRNKSRSANKLGPREVTIQQALDLFEDEAETQRWLSTPKEALGGKTPLEALDSESGCQKVEELLYRAEYGIFG